MSEQSAGRREWEPRITAFVCRWCTYAGADLAGTSRLKYPPQIRIVKLPCTGRIDTLFILRAFTMGADGVLVSGCHPGDCHYTSGNYIARRRFTIFRDLCDFVGLERERLHFSWVSAAEGGKFVEVVRKVTEAVRSVGPFSGLSPAVELRAGRSGEHSGEVAPASRASGTERDPGDLFAIGNLPEITADLESRAVKAVLGIGRGRWAGRLRPVWVRHGSHLQDLIQVSDPGFSLVTWLVRRLREDPRGAYGIIAGPKDREALGRLEAEHQIDPGRVRVYQHPNHEHQRREQHDYEQQQQQQDPAAAAIGRSASVRTDPVPGVDRPARERREFWNAEFARCLRCYACREVCPMCSCLRCVTDKTRPRWIDASSTAAGNWLWNLTRAFHLAGRCVECGSCAEACPVGIPLGTLGAWLNQAAERDFGPRPEGEKGKLSPLVTFTVEDEAPFIL